MKKTTSTSALRFALFAAAGAAACAWAPQAAADDAVPPTDLGTQTDLGGGQQWTVTGLQPSADQIAATPAGTLWEATATAAPAQGGIPVVPGFAARTPDGQDYPVMWNVPTPLGINPSPLAAGESATGKLYFDVTGAAPDSVTYIRDGEPVAVWVQPPPPPAGAPTTYGSGGGASTYVPLMQAAPAPVGVPRAAAPAAAGSSGTPAPAAVGTPAPAAAGSSGTPQPTTGSVGTPATPGSTTAAPTPTTPAPAGPAPAASAPQASTSPAAGTAPAGGTPAPAAAPTPAPASTPLPTTGSSGTTFTAPTTTPVPVPAGQ